MADALQRFLFESAPVRGEIVQLDSAFAEVLERHDYPPVLQTLLGELMAAAALLTATIKLDGTLIMQLHGTGAIRLLVVECTSAMTLRATARWEGNLPDASLAELLGHGKFAITLDPEDGEPYQGVVDFAPGQSVAQIIEHYMANSEQLPTRLWLASEDGRAGGLLVQVMPGQKEQAEDWSRVQALAETITEDELLSLPVEEVLYRLFHEETVRVFEPQVPQFSCSCSRERVGGMLKILGQEEVEQMLAELGQVDVTCEFCGASYSFDPIDAAQALAGAGVGSTDGTRH